MKEVSLNGEAFFLSDLVERGTDLWYISSGACP